MGKFSFASSFNKAGFGIDTTDFPFVKLSEIYNSEKEGGGEVIHPINGFFVHKSPLGVSPVLIDAENKRLVNLPGFMSDTVREILANSDAVEAIKNGMVGYTIYEYESHNRKCYNISFIDY